MFSSLHKNIFLDKIKLVLNDSDAKKIREIEVTKTPGKNIKIPNTIPLNKKIEYKLLKMIPIPNPLRNTDIKLNIIPKNVKEITKRAKIAPILHKTISHNMYKLLKFIKLHEKIPKSILIEDRKHPDAIPQ